MKKQKKENIKKLVLCALFAALSFAVTYLVPPIPLPFGYANLGDTVVLLTAFIVGGVWGSAAAGLGPMLADIFLGYGVYAPATFIIKAAMCFIAFMIFKKAKASGRSAFSFLYILFGCICAELIMALGYFVFELFLYGLGAFSSLPGNLLQGAANTVAAVLLISIIKSNKTLNKYL